MFKVGDKVKFRETKPLIYRIFENDIFYITKIESLFPEGERVHISDTKREGESNFAIVNPEEYLNIIEDENKNLVFDFY